MPLAVKYLFICASVLSADDFCEFADEIMEIGQQKQKGNLLPKCCQSCLLLCLSSMCQFINQEIWFSGSKRRLSSRSYQETATTRLRRFSRFAVSHEEFKKNSRL